MASPRSGRPPIIGSMTTLLVIIDAVLAALIIAEIGAPSATDGVAVGQVFLGVAATAILAATGTLATRRRPSNHSGAIMLACAALMPLTILPTGSNTALTVVAVVLATTPLGVLVHLLLAFPSGRLRSRGAQRTVTAGYAVCLVLQVPLYLFDPSASPGGVLAASNAPNAAELGSWVQRAAGLAVMIAAAAILAGRFRRAGARNRRVLGPLYLYGIVAVLAVPLTGAVIGPFFNLPASAVSVVQVVLLIAVPAAVAWAMLHGGFARTGNAQELGAWLSVADNSPGALRDALAASLGDPSVTLAFHGGEPAMLLSAQGTPVVAGAGTVEVDIAGRPVAVIGYDTGLIADPSIVSEAGHAVAIALDRARLAAELRARHRELLQSRMRIVQASDSERRRIAQNLHDGLQGDLVLLGIQAEELASLAGPDSAVTEAAADLRRRIDRAAANLRQVVHSVMPPALVSHGLIPAVEDLADRMPIPTRLELPAADVVRALPKDTQATAYFVIAESLTNAMKHARARDIAVRLSIHDDRLRLAVTDDGVGGADVVASADPRDSGLGLRSLRDRVSAIGGTLVIHSPVGGGTSVTAEMPCAS
jgi:signal transduction histidine kinase